MSGHLGTGRKTFSIGIQSEISAQSGICGRFTHGTLPGVAENHHLPHPFSRLRKRSEHNRHRGSGHPLSPATPPYMRVRIRRFDQLIPRSACGLGVCGSRTPCGFTSRVSIRCGFTALCLPKACRSRMASAIPPSRTQALLTLPIVQAFVARATTTPSADFCPAFAMSYDTTSHPRQPRQISRDKLDRLPRTTAGFTTSALDGYGLRDHLLARPAP